MPWPVPGELAGDGAGALDMSRTRLSRPYLRHSIEIWIGNSGESYRHSIESTDLNFRGTV